MLTKLAQLVGPLLFLIYINDLPLALNMISTPILFADDTSVIISNPDPFVFQDRLTEALKNLNIWFNTNLLFLNFSKTECIKFKTKNFYEQDKQINIAYDNKKISNSSHIMFLGINIVNTVQEKSY
jgi:GTP:adenosylcobinamide-phosphate guanylyltransferase